MDPAGKLDTEKVLDVASIAQSFTNHPYWSRMSRMLSRTEKAELETLLDPTAAEAHSVARASVVMCRKVLLMPFVDIEQGKAAVRAVEKHQARFGGLTQVEAQIKRREDF